MTSPRSTVLGLRAAGVALVLSAGLLVSGCGLLPTPAPGPTSTTDPAPPPSGSAEGGSQAEQCAQLMTDVQGIAADVARLGEMVASDPIGAFGLLGQITERVGDLQTRITDPELLERIEEIQSGWNAIIEDAQASVGSGDTAGIERAMAALTELGEQVAALQEFCAGTA